MKKRLIYPESPVEEKHEIPLIQGGSSETCAHEWVKTEIRGRRALKCTHCGKIIDCQD